MKYKLKYLVVDEHELSNLLSNGSKKIRTVYKYIQKENK